MKSIKKLLSDQAPEILPDEKIKNSIKQELGFEETEQVAAYAHGGTRQTASNSKKAKILISAAACLLALALFLGILIPLLKKNNLTLPGGGKFNQIQTSEDFYAYGAISVGSILSNSQLTSSAAAKTLSTKGLSMSFPTQAYTPTQEKNIETISKYLTLVEGLLSEGDIKHSAQLTPEGESDYMYKMSVSFLDLLGNTVSYTMYYNEIPVEDDRDEDDDDDGDDDGEIETEAEYSIVGELLLNGSRYRVEGSRETETETDDDETETESEMRFIAYLSDDESAYIEVKQELSHETEGNETEIEQQYLYTVCDGKNTEQTLIEYEEDEDGELELKMIVEAEDVKDVLFFQDASNRSERALKVRAEISGQTLSFRIFIRKHENGNSYYEYQFEDGSHSQHNRWDDDDDDD